MSSNFFIVVESQICLSITPLGHYRRGRRFPATFQNHTSPIHGGRPHDSYPLQALVFPIKLEFGRPEQIQRHPRRQTFLLYYPVVPGLYDHDPLATNTHRPLVPRMKPKLPGGERRKELGYLVRSVVLGHAGAGGNLELDGVGLEGDDRVVVETVVVRQYHIIQRQEIGLGELLVFEKVRGVRDGLTVVVVAEMAGSLLLQ